MQCPNDGNVLIMSERSGVRSMTVRRAAACGLIEVNSTRFWSVPRSKGRATPVHGRAMPRPNPRYDKHGQDGHGGGGNRKRRREGWFSELFD